MSITSYAQNFEDVMLWRALGHISHGFYIDLGAQHPIIDSVSKAFYEKGWRGFHAEATPAYAALLRQDRPDEIVIEAAVNDIHGVINFYEIPTTGISTGDQNVARSHKERGFAVREIVVPCVTLEDIFNQVGNKDIHWLKVDVECMEEKVLRSWGQSPARPWVVVVESTIPLTQIANHLPWECCLLERGYTHAYFDGLNRYYLASDQQDLASAFTSGPNVFDGFSLNGESSAPFCLAINERHRLAIQALQDQRNALVEEARQLKEQLTARTAQNQAIERQWKSKLQELLAQSKDAEHALTLSELALQQLASQSHQEAQNQKHSHLQHLVQREQEFSTQLKALDSRLNATLHTAQQCMIALEVEAREREYALHVKAAADLQQANHQSQARLDALSMSHQQREDALKNEKTQLQQRLVQDRFEYQKQIQVLEVQGRDREHALLVKAAADLHQAIHQAQARFNALSQSHQQREDAQQAEKKHLLQHLLEAKAVSQKHLQDWAHREQVVAQKNHDLQKHHHQQAEAWIVVNKDLSLSIEKLKQEIESLQAFSEIQARQHAKALDDQREHLERRNTALQISLENETHLASELQANLTALQRTWWCRVASRFSLSSKGYMGGRDTDPGPRKVSLQPVAEVRETVFEAAGSSPAEFMKQELPMTLDQMLALPGDSFIRVAYQHILGREADQTGIQHYLTQLRNGFGRAGVLFDLANSKEAKKIGPLRDLSALADDAYITAIYLRILGRAPDPEGLRHYQKVLRKYGCRRRMLSDIYTSAESFKRDPIKANFHRELTLLLRNVRQAKYWWKWKAREGIVLGEMHLLGERISDVARQVVELRIAQDLVYQHAIPSAVTMEPHLSDGKSQGCETTVSKPSIFELVRNIDVSQPSVFVEQLRHAITNSVETEKLATITSKK